MQNVYMTDEQNITPEQPGPAILLGRKIREARKRRGWTIAELADKLGRPREWVNRAELGYSEYGEYKPPSPSDIQAMAGLMSGCFTDPDEELVALAEAADAKFRAYKSPAAPRRGGVGKLTQTEVIIGEKQVVQAITDLINEQHSDAIIRNTGIKAPGHYMALGEEWKKYRVALGEFLNRNPNSLFKRVESVTSREQLEQAKNADEKVTGERSLKDVHNAKLKFYKHNPLQMHVVIGQREAILALPQTSGQAGSNVAILVRDKIFVEAMRVWYDEVLWDAPGECKMVDFADFKRSFSDLEQMYDFKE